MWSVNLMFQVGEDGVNDNNTSGVYYIQPTVKGWTDDGMTYSKAPKVDESLFAM